LDVSAASGEDLFLFTTFITYHTPRNWSQDMKSCESQGLGAARRQSADVHADLSSATMYCTARSRIAALFKSFILQTNSSSSTLSSTPKEALPLLAAK
jgi:hypothetical protein